MSATAAPTTQVHFLMGCIICFRVPHADQPCARLPPVATSSCLRAAKKKTWTEASSMIGRLFRLTWADRATHREEFFSTVDDHQAGNRAPKTGFRNGW